MVIKFATYTLPWKIMFLYLLVITINIAINYHVPWWSNQEND